MQCLKNTFDYVHKRLPDLIVWICLSGFFATFYYQIVLFGVIDDIPTWFKEILNGNADSPYNYRLLAPSFFTFIDYVSPLSYKKNYFSATFLIFLFSIGCLMRALSFSTSNRSSVVALLFAVTIP